MFSHPKPLVVKYPVAPRETFAFMLREDFYMCGVAVGKANLAHLVS